jgi:alkylhydroperoxidase/carboxymuconolactone decarboxylase family protein YurZ
MDTNEAKRAGATDEEINEAIAIAGIERHWSAVLDGMQIDLETFKSEFAESGEGEGAE